MDTAAQKEIRAEHGDQADKHRTIAVTVNGHTVVFHVHQADGAKIKSTAIEQHVPIQQDFNLFEKRPGHPLKPVGDADEVELHEGQEFRAVAPDDNSDHLGS